MCTINIKCSLQTEAFNFLHFLSKEIDYLMVVILHIHVYIKTCFISIIEKVKFHFCHSHCMNKQISVLLALSCDKSH